MFLVSFFYQNGFYNWLLIFWKEILFLVFSFCQIYNLLTLWFDFPARKKVQCNHWNLVNRFPRSRCSFDPSVQLAESLVGISCPPPLKNGRQRRSYRFYFLVRPLPNFEIRNLFSVNSIGKPISFAISKNEYTRIFFRGHK